MNEPDFAEPARLYGLDECEIAWRTPHSIFVWWELTEAGIARARTDHPVAANARRVLRLFKKHPGSGHREHRDFVLDWNEGNQHLPCAVAGATVRVAVGLLTDEGFFVPLAHSSVVRLPPGEPDHETASRWAVQEAADDTAGVHLSDALGGAGGSSPLRLRNVGWRVVDSAAPAASPQGASGPSSPWDGPQHQPGAAQASSLTARKETHGER